MGSLRCARRCSAKHTLFRRIRDNQYEFPPHRDVSLDARELVQQILTPNPQERPTLHSIIDHAFFTRGIVPGFMPVSARDAPPDFRHISPLVSQANLARLRQTCHFDEEVASTMSRNSEPPAPSASSATSSLAQQEREFHKAVQPGSPISALLSSARQPLMVGPAGGATIRGEPTLLRKLQAAKKEAARSPANVNKAGSRMQDIPEDGGGDGFERREEEVRMKELQSQKARIVAQMVPAQALRASSPFEDTENVPVSASEPAQGERRVRVRTREALPTVGSSSSSATTLTSGPTKMNGFDAAAETLCSAFDALAQHQLFRDPSDDIDLPEERVFIASWVDYCNKYGMGYALTDGSVGVHFNDSTTLVLAADKQFVSFRSLFPLGVNYNGDRHFDYISSRRQGTVYVRKNYTVGDYPEELKSKVYLLKHFEGYIMGKLYGDYEYTFLDLQRTKGMQFVQKYLRMKHVIVFKLSHDVLQVVLDLCILCAMTYTLQFNFYDHSKIILSAHGLAIAHIDKNYVLTRWTLSQVMARALLPPSTDREQAKFAQRLLDKLKYCKEVLLSIRNASAGIGAGGSGSANTTETGGVSAKPSKVSLR